MSTRTYSIDYHGDGFADVHFFYFTEYATTYECTDSEAQEYGQAWAAGMLDLEFE